VRLAESCGVSAAYTAYNGERRSSSARAIRAILATMGIDAGDDAACQAAYDRLESERRTRPLPPVTVRRAGDGGEVAVHVAAGATVELTLTLESGLLMGLAQARVEDEPPAEEPAPDIHHVRHPAIRRAVFLLPPDLPVGYHTLTAHVGAAPALAMGRLIVAPGRLDVPPEVRARRRWGFMAQLYSVRSRASWGIGDLADLRDLCQLAAAKTGADFMLVNPLHAAEPVAPLTPSPYLPSSRLFINPIYIRVEDIPEVAYMPGQNRSLLDWAAEKPRAASLSPALINRDPIWQAKRDALEMVFGLPRTVAREGAFAAFREREGVALEDFATWCVIVETRAAAGETGPLPAGISSPSAPGIAAIRSAHAERITFYAWLQWVADEQRASAQDAALRSGMAIGVITDIAVGVHPAGADAWAFAPVLATGVGVGAPPDMYNQLGQNWSQPPFLPRALEEAGYEPFRAVVRAALRHAGALRIDHILGLFRLWWVPNSLDGQGDAADGAYVRYDHEALFGVLCLEAERAGAIVIGEDLGTVEPWVEDYLASRGILGTTVAWWEREGDGSLRPPEHQRADVLATATTHDIPPTAAYLAGAGVDLREKLGLLARPVEEVRAEAAAERAEMVAFLLSRGWVTPGAGGEEPGDEEILIGIHRAVMAAPAMLAGVALTDAVGDLRTQNQPGTDREYPNWCVPLTDGRGLPVTLDTLFDHPRLRALVGAIREARP
jgi:4-alpha-glucanotransferase